MAKSRRKQVVIIGGGFAGLSAARALRRGPVDVTLLDGENHHLFQPLLYQVATAGLSPHEIAFPIRSLFSKNERIRVLLGDVDRIDPDARQVHLVDDGSVSYDYLVVAAGAKTNFFGNEQWRDYAFGLKSLRDAIRLRERVLMMFELAERERDPERRKELLTFVVIGGGPTGVELAGAISELGRRTLASDFHNIDSAEVRVVLLEMADRVLLPFDPGLSDSARRQLEELDVEVQTGAKVTSVDERSVTIGDTTLPASVVCWAPGVEPVGLAERSGFQVDHKSRIVVEEDCSIPGYPEAFAIGDIAALTPEGSDGPLPQLAPVAMQEGRHVAKMIRDDHRGLSRTPFRYRDKGIMATIGRSRAVAQSGPLKLTGFVAWIAWLVVHIAFLIGFRHRLFVLLEWFWSYIAWSRGARLVVARPELPGHSAGVDSYAAEPRPSSQDGGANAQGDEGATAGRDDGSDIQPAETPARRVS